MSKEKKSAEKPPESLLGITEDAVLFGSAIVGQKGQIVIPVSARRKLNITPGDKIFVFGKSKQLLALVKADKILELISEFTKRLDIVREALASDLEKSTPKK